MIVICKNQFPKNNNVNETKYVSEGKINAIELEFYTNKIHVNKIINT